MSDFQFLASVVLEKYSNCSASKNSTMKFATITIIKKDVAILLTAPSNSSKVDKIDVVYMASKYTTNK